MSVLIYPLDVTVQGTHSANKYNIPNGNITNAMIASGANVDATKLQHQQGRTHAQDSTATATAQTRVIYKCYGTSATIVDFEAGCVVANVGAATISVDLKKNGTTVLSSPISLSSSQTARQTVAGSILTASLVAGDVLEIVITVSASTGTLGQGVFAELRVNENPN